MKMFKFLSGAAFATLLVMSASCDDPQNPGTPLQPDDQKTKLEDVAVKLLEKTPASDMENLVDLYNSFCQDYLEDDYDFSALESFGEDALKDSYRPEEREYLDMKSNEYIRESVINVAVALSNHKGEFTFGRNAVVKENDSTFDGVKVNAQVGSKNYVFELKSSGKVTEASYNYLYFSKEDAYGYWDESLQSWVDREVVRVWDEDYKFNIDVPEKIEIGLYEESKYVAKITINMTKNFSADGLNPAVDNFNANVKVEFNNGYALHIDKFAFDGAKKQAGSSFKFVKDGEALVSATASGDVELINSVREYEGDSYSYEYTSVELKKAKNLSMSVDILGEVQMKGTCSNAKDASDALEAYWDALRNWDDETGNEKTPDETTALRHLGNFNAKINLGVYYDGTETRQATVVFEMDKYTEEAYWDRNGDGVTNELDAYTYYDLIPVIVFGDGSRYTVEDYFTEEAFERLLDRVEDYEDDYNDLIGTIVEDKVMMEPVRPQENL